MDGMPNITAFGKLEKTVITTIIEASQYVKEISEDDAHILPATAVVLALMKEYKTIYMPHKNSLKLFFLKEDYPRAKTTDALGVYHNYACFYASVKFIKRLEDAGLILTFDQFETKTGQDIDPTLCYNIDMPEELSELLYGYLRKGVLATEELKAIYRNGFITEEQKQNKSTNRRAVVANVAAIIAATAAWVAPFACQYYMTTNIATEESQYVAVKDTMLQKTVDAKFDMLSNQLSSINESIDSLRPKPVMQTRPIKRTIPTVKVMLDDDQLHEISSKDNKE